MINSRRKGTRGEREVAKLLTDLGFPARRSQQYNGLGKGDVVIEGSDLHIEVKYGQGYGLKRDGTPNYMLRRAMEQAERDADGKPWVVFWRQKREEWRMIDADELIWKTNTESDRCWLQTSLTEETR